MTDSQPDPQDPLPESNWFFRRLCMMGSLAFLWAVVGWEVYFNRPIDPWVWYSALTVLVLYTVAPSAEQVAKMIATVSILKPTGALTLTPASPPPPAPPPSAPGELPPDQRVVRP